ncbi:MAG: hypothetical protein AAGC55_27260, partial [Myxococcota bacterium]
PVDPRTDVYGLGILTYEMLTAKLPFIADSRSGLEKMHLSAEPPRPSRDAPVPPAVDEVVARCLAKTREQRYPSPSAFLAALRAALSDGPTPATRSTSERRAAAILVEIRSDSAPGESAEQAGAEAQYDEDALDAIMDILDISESTLSEDGFAIPLQTSTSLLAIRLLPTVDSAGDGDGEVEADAESAARRAVLVRAGALHRELAETAATCPGLVVEVIVHSDAVEVRGSADRRTLGGPLLQIARWPDSSGSGIRATRAAIRDTGWNVDSAGE